jgi:hypothetical protein
MTDRCVRQTPSLTLFDVQGPLKATRNTDCENSGREIRPWLIAGIMTINAFVEPKLDSVKSFLVTSKISRNRSKEPGFLWSA